MPLDLTWDAPPDCPDAAAVRGRIERILRVPVSDPAGAVARGTIERRLDGRFHLAMSVRTGDLEDARAIDAASCPALGRAFAVVVALAIDPTREPDASDEDLPPAEEPVLTSSPLPPAHSAKREVEGPHPSPPSPWDSRFAAAAGGAMVWGPLPEASPALAGSLLVRIDRFRVGLVGTLSLPQSPHFDAAAGATFAMFSLGAFGAYMVPLGPIAIGPAANLELTHLTVRGFGIRNPWETSAVWPTGVLGGRIEARFARWFGLFARGDALVSADVPKISLATSTQGVALHTPATWSGRMSFGAEVIFP